MGPYVHPYVEHNGAPASESVSTDAPLTRRWRALQADLPADLQAELIALFCEALHRYLHQLRRANAACDTSEVAFAAEALRGSSVNMGAAQLAALCGQIEVRAAAGSLEGTSPILARVEAEAARVEAALLSRGAAWRCTS